MKYLRKKTHGMPNIEKVWYEVYSSDRVSPILKFRTAAKARRVLKTLPENSKMTRGVSHFNRDTSEVHYGNATWFLWQGKIIKDSFIRRRHRRKYELRMRPNKRRGLPPCPKPTFR